MCLVIFLFKSGIKLTKVRHLGMYRLAWYREYLGEDLSLSQRAKTWSSWWDSRSRGSHRISQISTLMLFISLQIGIIIGGKVPIGRICLGMDEKTRIGGFPYTLDLQHVFCEEVFGRCIWNGFCEGHPEHFILELWPLGEDGSRQTMSRSSI